MLYLRAGFGAQEILVLSHVPHRVLELDGSLGIISFKPLNFHLRKPRLRDVT